MLDVRSAAVLADRFALGSDAVLSGPVARGEQGQVWRLSTSLGTWAVKEPFVTQRDSQARADADFQDAARAGGVPMPRVMRTPGGDVLVALGSAVVRIYEWVDLAPPDIDIDAAAVGRAIAALHRVRTPGSAPVDPWNTEPVGGARWDELVWLVDASGAPFAADLARYHSELVALEAVLEAPAAVQICHCDLWADNVLGTPAGGLCIIDWENCGPADPSQELAMVLFEFAGTRSARARALYGAYVDAGGPGRIDRPGNFSMVIAQQGHILEYDCEGWLDATDAPDERVRRVGRVEEFTSRPLTCAVIDCIIDAVGS